MVEFEISFVLSRLILRSEYLENYERVVSISGKELGSLYEDGKIISAVIDSDFRFPTDPQGIRGPQS